MLTSGEPLEQVTTPRGPFMGRTNLTLSETVFLWIGPLFRRIGPRVSQDRTFSKTNAPIPKKHPVFLERLLLQTDAVQVGLSQKWCDIRPLLQTVLHHCFQFLTVGSRYFLVNLHVVQFQYGFELRRLSCS